MRVNITICISCIRAAILFYQLYKMAAEERRRGTHVVHSRLFSYALPAGFQSCEGRNYAVHFLHF